VDIVVIAELVVDPHRAIGLVRGGGVFEGNEQSARVLDQAENRQPARLAGQSKHKNPCSPVPHRAVLAARVDEEVGAVCRLHSRKHAIGGIMRKVFEPVELRPFLRLDRRLWVRFEQAVAALPEFFERILSTKAIQVADPTSPIDEIEER